jgi:hypothetical protein
MLKTLFCFLVLGSFCFGQTYEQLMSYSHYYSKDIQAFREFINTEPSASHSNSGIEQVVYELHNHNIGLEEHKSDNGKIGEIYVFQTNENHDYAQSQWNEYLSKMSNDGSLDFVKGFFDDGIVKEDNLAYEELLSLINSRTLNLNRSYGIRYTKAKAFFSLFIVKGKMVFTVDDKNY